MVQKEHIFIEEMSNWYVNLFKVGIFWRAYEHSALYLNKIMWYKLCLDFTSWNKLVLQVWFPEKNLDTIEELIKTDWYNYRKVNLKDSSWEYFDKWKMLEINKQKLNELKQKLITF